MFKTVTIAIDVVTTQQLPAFLTQCLSARVAKNLFRFFVPQNNHTVSVNCKRGVSGYVMAGLTVHRLLPD
jgi:hypothetical protein